MGTTTSSSCCGRDDAAAQWDVAVTGNKGPTPAPGIRNLPNDYQVDDESSVSTRNVDAETPQKPGAANTTPKTAEMSKVGAAATPADRVTTQKLTYTDGSTYEGEINGDGLRHGKGVWTSSHGSYAGGWNEDKQHGAGRQTWADGRVYAGQFKDGSFDGRGRMEWHLKEGLMIYDGTYVDDKKHGEGKFIWPDGRSYDGGWLDGKRSGKALYLNSNGEIKAGLWKEDKLIKWLEDDAVGKNA